MAKKKIVKPVTKAEKQLVKDVEAAVKQMIHTLRNEIFIAFLVAKKRGVDEEKIAELTLAYVSKLDVVKEFKGAAFDLTDELLELFDK